MGQGNSGKIQFSIDKTVDMPQLYIEPWALRDKGYAGNEISMHLQDAEIIKETEKAYLIQVTGDDVTGEYARTYSAWFPKVAVKQDYYPIDYENTIWSDEVKGLMAWDRGLQYNQKLKQVAKANGIKVSNGRVRNDTIIERLNQAGVKVPKKPNKPITDKEMYKYLVAHKDEYKDYIIGKDGLTEKERRRGG